MCSTSSSLQPRATCEIQSRVLISLHYLEHFFTLSHSLSLHESHLNTWLLIAKIQANLARNKTNKIVDWIQPYNLPLWLFRDKTLKQTLDLTCELGTVKQCKVEFNQPSCWFYSVSNLLIIQHLETLYLGENHVRVVCERVWRKAQECAFKKSLTIGSCD